MRGGGKGGSTKCALMTWESRCASPLASPCAGAGRPYDPAPAALRGGPRSRRRPAELARTPAGDHAEGNRRHAGREMRNRAVRRQAPFPRPGAGADRSGVRPPNVGRGSEPPAYGGPSAGAGGSPVAGRPARGGNPKRRGGEGGRARPGTSGEARLEGRPDGAPRRLLRFATEACRAAFFEWPSNPSHPSGSGSSTANCHPKCSAWRTTIRTPHQQDFTDAPCDYLCWATRPAAASHHLGLSA
jgi:hypothetical protein